MSDYDPTLEPTPNLTTQDDSLCDYATPQEQEQLLRKLQRAHTTLVDFRQELLDNPKKDELKSPMYHHEWSDILLHGKDHFNIQAFRESGKTSIVLRAFPLYRLMFPSPDARYICLVKRNQDLAGDKLLEIQREYKSNIFLKQNLIKITEESASAFQITVLDPKTNTPMEIRIEAHGKGGTLRGALWGAIRPQVIIIDDIQAKDDMDSDRILERDWQWFLDDVLFLTKYGRIFMISNNLGEKCLSERIMNTPSMFGFNCVRLARTTSLEPDGIPAWPAKESQEMILKEYERYRDAHEESIWVRNSLCLCMSSQDQVFTRDMFQYIPESRLPHLLHESLVYIRMDTAVTDKTSSDYTAIVVFAINPENHVFVIDISYGHFNTDKKYSELFRLIRKWNPYNVGIERTNESIRFIEDLRKRMPLEKCFFSLIELRHGGKRKEIRIETALQPRFSTKTVWFIESASWLKELEHELLMFTKTGKRSLHDDLIDALAYLNDNTQVPQKRSDYKPYNPANASGGQIGRAKCVVTVA